MDICREDHAQLRQPDVWKNLKCDGFMKFAEDSCMEMRRCPFCQTSLSAACSLAHAMSETAKLAALTARTLESLQ